MRTRDSSDGSEAFAAAVRTAHPTWAANALFERFARAHDQRADFL